MTRYTILLFLSLSFVGSSCKKDFLEVIDKTKLLTQGYVVDLSTTEHYMNGIYGELASTFAGLNNMPLPELVADNLKPATSSASTLEIYNWNQSAGLNRAGPWYDDYRIIRACNFVIEKTEEYKSQNINKANNLKGQALTIRAWMHFTIVNFYAQSFSYSTDASHLGIPYILTSDIEESIKRESVADVYEAMIGDLNEALQLLPAAIADKQYINYQAARALLARIYLFKSDYVMARNLARQVLNDVPLMTSNYPGKLYTAQETEALFQVPPGNSTSSNYSTFFLGNYLTAVIRYIAPMDIVQLYRSYPADKRNAWIRDSTIGKVINKFPKGVTGNHTSPAADYYQTFFRSTEMALSAAEAYAATNMEDSARFFINAIRTRAGIPTITAAITGVALLDSIKIERRKEMAFDGIRLFDLLRWKQSINRQDALTPAAKILPYPSNKAIFPIPLEDVQIAGLEQNPDY